MGIITRGSDFLLYVYNLDRYSTWGIITTLLLTTNLFLYSLMSYFKNACLNTDIIKNIYGIILFYTVFMGIKKFTFGNELFYYFHHYNKKTL